MSASKEKIKRQEIKDSGADTKQAKILEKEKADKKYKLLVKIVVACVAVFAVVVILFSSSILYNTFTAVEIGDERYTVADVNYYYQTVYAYYYDQYYASYGEYAEYFMPEEAAMKEEAVTTLQEMSMLCAEAEKVGYELPQEEMDEINAQLDSLLDVARSYGYTTVNSYLTAVYGKGMTEKIFTENMINYTLAGHYSESIRESYEYTQDEIETYYEENRSKYDVITARVFLVEAEADADGNYDLDASDAVAKEFMNKITDEQSFIELAREYASEATKEQYEDDDATLSRTNGENTTGAYATWLTEETRSTGDKTYVRGTTGTYVVYFVNRDVNDYNTIDVRHILVEFEAGVSAESEEVTDVVKELAYEEAEMIYQEWQDGEATEASFAALADQYSDDSPEGGLYENVYKNQMVQAFNDWCFSTSRESGDTAIIETEYGYHVMYFVGENIRYADYLADTGLRTDDLTAWKDELAAAEYPSQTTWLLSLVG